MTAAVARGRLAPSARLSAVVRQLRRARERQLLVDAAWVWLLGGLLLATASTVLMRLTGRGESALQASAVLLAAALAGTLATAWWRRPGTLDVAIRADVALGLKQRLSTAVEVAASGVDPALAERLAGQAVRARLPARPDLVFPARLGTWGRMVPIAAALLVLVSIIDLGRVTASDGPVVDPVIAGEGLRLREYGRRMEARARAAGLPRSQAESRKMQRLGSRMESGALERGEALSRLRELGSGLDRQRASALTEGRGVGGGALGAAAEQAGSRLRALLESLLGGGQAPGELLEQDPRMLSQLGTSQEALRNALERFSEGDAEALREILESLSQRELSGLDAEELELALDQVRRTRENLGDAVATVETPLSPRDELPGASRPGEETLPGAFPGGEDAGLDDLGDFGQGSGIGSEPAGELAPSAPSDEQRGFEAVLRPKAQPGEGVVYQAGTRVLPRAGEVAQPRVELDARFEAQVEQVLAKEEYPLHFKEYIRRYFLSLSQGVQAPGGEAQP